MKKTEKKSILPKLIVILLMVMLVSTSLLSRTLARYISSGELVNSEVRVAKWGVEVTPATDTLFSDTYDAEDADFTGDVVASIDQELVVAPGTSGTTANFTITGTPEVATRVSITDRGSSIDGWTHEVATGVYYEPVLWTVTQGGTTILNAGSFDDMLETIEDNIYEFEPNTDLSSETYGFVISWEWPFDGNDEGDTIYGDMDDAPTITLALDVTVVQID